VIAQPVFITGTGTDVGKTVVSATLCVGLNARYWKPVQCGPDLDREFVARWIGRERIHPGVYELQAPLSPHQAAPMEDQIVDMNRILAGAKELRGPAIVEGAGGLLVPLNGQHFVADLIRALGARPIVVAATGLGTINHTLLTIEALRARDLEPLGVIFNGDENLKNQDSIERYGYVPVIGRIPRAQEFTRDYFQSAFARLKWPIQEETEYARIH
jgi:dethiobiotin synthase